MLGASIRTQIKYVRMRALDLIAVGQHGRGRVVAFRGSFRGYRSTVDIYLRTTRQQEIVLKLKQFFKKKKNRQPCFLDFSMPRFRLTFTRKTLRGMKQSNDTT